MTQGLQPPPPPNHGFNSSGLPMGDYNVSPTGMAFNDSFAGARRSTQGDYGDLPQRVKSMNLGNDGVSPRKGSLSRRRSVSGKSSIRQPSESFTTPASPDYELYRLDKVGEDWTDVDRYILSTSQKELAVMAKKGKSKSGTVVEQMKRMVHTRRSQIDELTEKKYNETGMHWEPVYIEEGKSTITNGRRNIRSMDVIVARVRGSTSGPVRPSLANFRPTSTSYKGERVVVSDRNNSRDQTNWKGGSKNDDSGKKQVGKDNKAEPTDPDPFGSSKLFAPSGKTLPTEGLTTAPHIDLPPHIQMDEPIGKRPKQRGKSSQRGDDYDNSQGDHNDIDILEDPLGGKGGAELLGDINFDDILPKGKKNKKKSHSRSRSKSRRPRSESRSRSRAHADHRNNRGRRVNTYMGDHSSSGSSTGSEKSMYMVDDNSSVTSESIHRDMKRRGSLHRRNSSRSSQPFREHYRGPRQSARYSGEQILIPERRVSYVYPPAKQIAYIDPYHAGAVGYPRSPSPRRDYGYKEPRRNNLPPEVLYPHEFPQDRNMEARVNGYMQQDRLKEYDLNRRERELQRREVESRRQSGYYGGQLYH